MKDFASMFSLVYNCNQITCFLLNFPEWYFTNQIYLNENHQFTEGIDKLIILRNDFTKDEHTLIDETKDEEDDREPEIRQN